MYADSYGMDEDEIVFMSAGCRCCSESYRIELDTPGNESDAIADGVRHWHWPDVPTWVKEEATLNGDDISDVTLIPTGHALSIDDINRGEYCTVIVRPVPKGLLIFGHHA